MLPNHPGCYGWQKPHRYAFHQFLTALCHFGGQIRCVWAETLRHSLLISLLVLPHGLTGCFSPADLVPGSSSGDAAHINNKTKFSQSAYGVTASPRVTTSRNVRKGGGRRQIGKPYKIKGKWYTPKEEPGYDKVGNASWYGPNFHGRLTANGEVYDQYALSGTHPTFPLPSYARVTNIANGRSVIVRVNDRGPYHAGRIIDLSAKAAGLLDYQRRGIARVRVQYIGQAPLHGRDAKYLNASYEGQSGAGRSVLASRSSKSPGLRASGATGPRPSGEVNNPMLDAMSTGSIQKSDGDDPFVEEIEAASDKTDNGSTLWQRLHKRFGARDE